MSGAAQVPAGAGRLVFGRWRPGKRGLLTLVLVAAVAAATAHTAAGDGLPHTGGLDALATVLHGIVELELSAAFLLGKLLPAAGVTMAYAMAAMSLALLLGVPAAVVGSGVLQGRRASRLLVVPATRGLLATLRAVDELIWAYVLVFVFGLSPWAGVLGIGVPYGATVARVLAERLQDVPEGPLVALRSAGASRMQLLVYGRLPHALADATGYLLYRFECAIRSAAVLSFVGLGGLGLQLTIALDDLDFGQGWTVLLALIGLVVVVDRSSTMVRRRIQDGEHPARSARRIGDDRPLRDAELEAAHSLWRSRGSVTPGRIPWPWLAAVGAVVAASWWYVVSQSHGGFEPSELAANLAVFLERLGGATTTGGLQDPQRWSTAASLAFDTVVMSVLAAGVAGVAAMISIGLAGSASTGSWASPATGPGRATRAAMRTAHVVTRSIPEYLWALMVVFVLQAGIVAGAVALALHNFGVLGRLGTDVVDDLDDAPLASLRSSGASRLQLLFYGVVPQVLPQLLTFLLYRWEVMIRASAVVGFVTAAGLGYALRLALARFDYPWIAVLLVTYVLLTLTVDLFSSGLRRLAR